MQYKVEMDNIFLNKVMLFVLVLTAFLIMQGTTKTAFGITGKNEPSKQVTGDNTEVGQIYFENKWVEAGIPLKVMGAPKNSTYQWVITGADGLKNTFTTKDNTYTPTEKDLEKLINVTVNSNESESASIYYSNLPVIYIENFEGYYGVKDIFSGASLHMQGNKEFNDSKELYEGRISIKLRGNSTKLCEKRPFNISLDKKTSLFGMGKNKHWALLSNYIDHTLMRNKLLYDFSGAIGMDTYSKSENVILIFNNEYYGVYQLCELVNVGSKRVDIYDWEESAEDAAEAIVDELEEKGKLSKENKIHATKILKNAMRNDLNWITSPYRFTFDVDEDGIDENYKVTDYISLPAATGGALLEMDFYNFEGKNASSMITNYSQPLYFKSPEYASTNHTLYNYMNNYIQSFEYALHSTDFTYHDSREKYYAFNRSGGSFNSGYGLSDFSATEFDGLHYSELFDMNSLIQNFIVCEFSMNWDGMKNSVFMYKDTDGLFKMGPEWDFDWAWGNANMYLKNTWYPTSWQTTEDAFTKEQFYQRVQWNRCLIRDPYFLIRTYEKYKKIRNTVIQEMIKRGGTIDIYTKELKAAAAANDRKWSYTYPGYHSVGFAASVRNMKKFIHTRINWMDKQFKSIDSMVKSLGYFVPDEDLKITKIDSKSKKGYAIITARIDSPDITSIALQLNGTNIYKAEVSYGKAVCRIPITDLVKQKDILNIVQISALDKKGNYMISSEDEGNYAMSKSNYAIFYTGGSMIHENAPVRMYLIIIIAVLMIMGTGLGIYLRIHRNNLKKVS